MGLLVMKLFSLLPLLVLAAARNIRIDQIEYGFCEGADESVGSPDIIDVQPFPVVVATGETVTLTVQLTMADGHDIPLPCLEIDGAHLGSCDYDAQYLLPTYSDFLCPDYFPDGQECMLPLGPGVYGGGKENPLTITLPEIPSIIADLLAAGTYYASATLKTADGADWTCGYVRLALTS